MVDQSRLGHNWTKAPAGQAPGEVCSNCGCRKTSPKALQSCAKVMVRNFMKPALHDFNPYEGAK